MEAIGRCQAPGCTRSARTLLAVEGPATRVQGLTCPRHATSTELGALLTGATVRRA